MRQAIFLSTICGAFVVTVPPPSNAKCHVLVLFGEADYFQPQFLSVSFGLIGIIIKVPSVASGSFTRPALYLLPPISRPTRLRPAALTVVWLHERQKRRLC